VSLNTTDRYLQIGIGPKGLASPRLPDAEISPQPIQVWLHSSLFGDQAAWVVENWVELRAGLASPVSTPGLATLLQLPQQSDNALPLKFATAPPWVVISAGGREERIAGLPEPIPRDY
jgi:hypothetical protein